MVIECSDCGGLGAGGTNHYEGEEVCRSCDGGGVALCADCGRPAVGRLEGEPICAGCTALNSAERAETVALKGAA